MPTIFERVNHSHIFIQLTPFGERKETQEQVAAGVRKIMLEHPAFKPTYYPGSLLSERFPHLKERASA